MKKDVGSQVLDAGDVLALKRLSAPSVDVLEAHKPGKLDLAAANALWKSKSKLSIQHKLDGFRVQVFVKMLGDGGFKIKVGTGSWKVLPNKYVVSRVTDAIEAVVNSDNAINILKRLPVEDRVMLFDGEIETYTLDQHKKCTFDPFSTIQQKLTTENATDVDFVYSMFDVVNIKGFDPGTMMYTFSPYSERFVLLHSLVENLTVSPAIAISDIEKVDSSDFASGGDLLKHIQWIYDSIVTASPNLEGLVIWNLDSCYRAKRAGVKNPTLFKLKPFEDSEAIIVDVVPLQRNTASADTMPTGRSRKSSRMNDMVVDYERVGSLVVVNIKGEEFNIGSGFSDDKRLEMMRQHLKGDCVGTS